MSNARFSIVPSKAVKDPDLSDAVFRTLAALGIYGDDNGWCWPALKTLAEIRGKTRQAVSKDIQILKAKGYLNVAPRFTKDKGQTSNKYQIKFDYPPSTSEDYPPSTPAVDPPSTSEVDHNAPLNDPMNAPIKEATPSAPDVLTSLDYPKALLNTPFFMVKWREWWDYRKEIKKPLKATTAKKQLAFLEAQGRDAIEVLEQSMVNGWTGLFPLKKNGQGAQHPPAKKDSAEDVELARRILRGEA